MSEVKAVKETVTSSVREMLWGGAAGKRSEPWNDLVRRIESLPTVYLMSAKAGLSLEEYVAADPDRAVRAAEAYYAQSFELLSHAMELMSGVGPMEMQLRMKLLKMRLDFARSQVAEVKEAALTCARDGMKRKDMLLNAMYNKAVYKGDTRAAMYLVDRVDGRPAAENVDVREKDYAYNVYLIIHSLFQKQLEVLNHGNGTMLICCSRRAGKSLLLVAACLIEALRNPNTMCIYIGETLGLTEALVDSTANVIIDKCGLKDMSGNRLDWKRLDNGSKIMVRGLSNTKDPDTIRGFKSKIIVIDEFFHLKSHLLEYLQVEVLQPMQLDYADEYKFICAGTPPRVKNTYGELAWVTWDCPKFQWTWEDNPHPVDVEERRKYIDKIVREKGLDYTSPFVRREYFGEWVYDDDLLLYADFCTWDIREAVPAIRVSRVLFGLDYGVSDNDAIIGIAWSDEDRRGYVFFEAKFSRLDLQGRGLSQLAKLRKEVEAAWTMAMDFFPTLSPREANKRILWDADDNDQHVTDDLMANVVMMRGGDALRLNIQNAHKTDKVLMFDKIRDLLRTAGLLLPKGGKTAAECESTILRRGPNGEVYPEVDDTAFHPDLLPAMRYALWNVLGGM